jgi:hypothetical protein
MAPLARPQRVELRVVGDVGDLVPALFGDASYVVEPTTTTIVREVEDDRELQDLCHRIRDAGVDLVGLRRLDPPADEPS